MKTVTEIKTFDERKDELIKLGKEKGYITFEKLAASLQGLEMDADSLDSLYNALVEEGISVVTEEEAVKKLLVKFYLAFLIFKSSKLLYSLAKAYCY